MTALKLNYDHQVKTELLRFLLMNLKHAAGKILSFYNNDNNKNLFQSTVPLVQFSVNTYLSRVLLLGLQEKKIKGQE